MILRLPADLFGLLFTFGWGFHQPIKANRAQACLSDIILCRGGDNFRFNDTFNLFDLFGYVINFR